MVEAIREAVKKNFFLAPEMYVKGGGGNSCPLRKCKFCGGERIIKKNVLRSEEKIFYFSHNVS